MVAMAALQVFIVKMFFTGGRKGESILLKRYREPRLIYRRIRLDTKSCIARLH